MIDSEETNVKIGVQISSRDKDEYIRTIDQEDEQPDIVSLLSWLLLC